MKQQLEHAWNKSVGEKWKLTSLNKSWQCHFEGSILNLRTTKWSFLCREKALLTNTFTSLFRSSLTYGHKSWVVTEKVLSEVQAAGCFFLRRVHGMTLRDKVRSCEIRKALNVEPLLLRIARFQPSWFGHVTRMTQEKLARLVLLATPTGKRPRGQPRARWRKYISDLT